MTTISLQNTILDRQNFQDIWELFIYIIQTHPAVLEWEDFSVEERIKIESRGSWLRAREKSIDRLLTSVT